MNKKMDGNVDEKMSFSRLHWWVSSLLMALFSLLSLVAHYEYLHPSQDGIMLEICKSTAVFSCENAYAWKYSSLFGVPIAFFGFILSIAFALYPLILGDGYRRTINFLSVLNTLGILVLAGVSLSLGSFCLYCTGYYLSSIYFFIISKGWQRPFKPGLKSLGVVLVLMIVLGFIGVGAFEKKEESPQDSTNYKQIITDGFFRHSIPVPPPSIDSPFYVNRVPGSKALTDAPIWIAVYMDYLCPHCQNFEAVVKKVLQEPKYGQKVNVSTYFFPLDGTCSTFARGKRDGASCTLANMATYEPSRFEEVNNRILSRVTGQAFSNTAALSLAKELGLEKAVNDKQAAAWVTKLYRTAKEYEPYTKETNGISGTPTIIINGRLIAGELTEPVFRAILDFYLEDGASPKQ